VSHAPALIRLSNPLASKLLKLGLPMGPNVLLTVRGRTSGLPRSMPVAIAELDGRRWVIGAYGDVQWVRNLRAAGEAHARLHGQAVHFRAHELSADEALAFYTESFPRFLAQLPAVGRAFSKVFFGLVGPEFLNDPARAAQTKPVFELLPG